MADSVRDRLWGLFSQGGQAGLEGYKQSQNAKLEQLLLGQKNQQQLEQEQRQRAAYDQIRSQVGPKADVRVGDISVSGVERKPMLMQLTPAQEAAEKEAGRNIAEYGTGGGAASVDKNLGLLEQTAKELEGSKRGIGTQLAGALPKTLRDYLVPEDVAKEDRVRTAVQSTLRQVMGSQFTEKEGQAMMERAYNPRLSAKENISRIRAIAQELSQKRSQIEGAKARYQKTGYATMGEANQPQMAPQMAPQEQQPGQLSPRQQRIQELRQKLGK